MKAHLILLLAAGASLPLCSCGSKKGPTAGVGDYQYQQFLAQQYQQYQQQGYQQPQVYQYQQNQGYQQQYQQPQQYQPSESQQSWRRPKRKLMEIEPAVKKALEQSDCLRSFGESSGFSVTGAIDQAMMVAQERMSVMLRSSLEAAAKNYVRNANINLDNTSATLYESIAKRFSINTSKNTRMIDYTPYELDNGQVMVMVCIEARSTDSAVAQQLTNELSRAGFLGLQFDRKRFEAETEAALGAYREELKQEGSVDVEE